MNLILFFHWMQLIWNMLVLYYKPKQTLKLAVSVCSFACNIFHSLTVYCILWVIAVRNKIMKYYCCFSWSSVTEASQLNCVNFIWKQLCVSCSQRCSNHQYLLLHSNSHLSGVGQWCGHGAVLVLRNSPEEARSGQSPLTLQISLEEGCYSG